MPATNRVAAPANSPAGPPSAISCTAPRARPPPGRCRSRAGTPKGSVARCARPPSPGARSCAGVRQTPSAAQHAACPASRSVVAVCSYFVLYRHRINPPQIAGWAKFQLLRQAEPAPRERKHSPKRCHRSECQHGAEEEATSKDYSLIADFIHAIYQIAWMISISHTARAAAATILIAKRDRLVAERTRLLEHGLELLLTRPRLRRPRNFGLPSCRSVFPVGIQFPRDEHEGNGT